MSDANANIGLPSSYYTKFPTHQEIRAMSGSGNTFGSPADAQAHDASIASASGPANGALASLNSGSVPTPLTGAGNSDNPGVAVGNARVELPVPSVMAAPIPMPDLGYAAGVQPAVGGLFIQAGSDVRGPLVPGVKPVDVADTPPSGYGLGTK